MRIFISSIILLFALFVSLISAGAGANLTLETGTLTKIIVDPLQKNELDGDYIEYIISDFKGNIWKLTVNFSYDENTNTTLINNIESENATNGISTIISVPRSFNTSDRIDIAGNFNEAGLTIPVTTIKNIKDYNNSKIAVLYYEINLKIKPPQPPLISALGCNIINTSAVEYKWNTTTLADTDFRYSIYSETNEYRIYDAAFSFNHSANMKNLTPGTKYYYTMLATDQNGYFVRSEQNSFTMGETGTCGGAILDTTSPASVTNLTNITFAPLYINWTWTPPQDGDFNLVQVYIDGSGVPINVSNTTNYYNASFFKPNSTHTISTKTMDTSGNVNKTGVNSIVNTSTALTYVLNFTNTTGTMVNPEAAKNDSDARASAVFTESLTESTSDLHNYTNVTSYNATNGTIANFLNMQNSIDAGAFANLTEGQALTTLSNRTKNPIKSITNGSQSSTYIPSYLDVADGNIDVTISNISQPVYIVKHASADPTMVTGSITGGSYLNTVSSDNSYLNLREVGGGNSGRLDSNWNNWQAVTEVSNSSIIEMNIGIEAYVADGEAVYIQLWDFPGNNWNTTWHQIGTSGLPTSDTNTVFWYNITNANEIARFVDATGNYRIRFTDAKVAIGSTDNVRSYFYIDEFKVIFKYNLYTLNASYTFIETNSSATWQSISIKDSSYGNAIGNVSILNATSGRWESILTSVFTGGTSPVEHVNVVNGASGNASNYDAGGGQIKIRYNWTNSSSNNSLGVDMINITVLYSKSTFSLKITTNTTNVPVDTNYYLEINYSCNANETYDVYVYNGSVWNLKGSLASTAWTQALFTLNSADVINGNVSVRYIDQTPLGTNLGNMSIDYQRIHGITPGIGIYSLNVTSNTTDVPEASINTLQIGYNVSAGGDNFTLRIWNGSFWNNRTTLNDTSYSYRNITLQSDELMYSGYWSELSGTVYRYYVLVHYTDMNINSTQQGKLYLDYQRVYSS